MNIYKKTMLLMALCCSIGVTTSAVEMNKEAKAKYSKVAEFFKKDVSSTIEKIMGLLNNFDITEDSSENISKIFELEDLGFKIGRHQHDMFCIMDSIRNKENVLQTEKQGQLHSFQLTLKRTNTIITSFKSSMIKTLEIIGDQLPKGDALRTVQKLLDEVNTGNTGNSLSGFLFDMELLGDMESLKIINLSLEAFDRERQAILNEKLNQI